MKKLNTFLMVCALLGMVSIMQAPDGMEGYEAGERGIGTGKDFLSTEGLTEAQHERLLKWKRDNPHLVKVSLQSERDKIRGPEVEEDDEHHFILTRAIKQGMVAKMINQDVKAGGIGGTIRRSLGKFLNATDHNENIDVLAKKLGDVGIDPETEEGRARIDRALSRDPKLKEAFFKVRATDIFNERFGPYLEGVSGESVAILQQKVPKLITDSLKELESKSIDPTTKEGRDRLMQIIEEKAQQDSALQSILEESAVEKAFARAQGKWTRSERRMFGVGVFAALAFIGYIIYKDH